jgi:acetolactate synthase small subunit
MKKDFTLDVVADNSFSILNRIVNVLNRRRIRIKKLVAYENEDDHRTGGASVILYTTPEMIEKIKQQMEKLVEVYQASYWEGSEVPAPQRVLES